MVRMEASVRRRGICHRDIHLASCRRVARPAQSMPRPATFSLRRFANHAFALLDGVIVGPPQMRRGAAQRTPWFCQRRHLLHGRALLETEPDLDGFLNGNIARRPCIAMTETK